MNESPAAEILNANILIVDDQASNVSLLEQLLSEAGYARRHIDDAVAETSARCIARTAIDLILLDLQMPGMDGFQVMEGLKTNADDGYLPVIVLTAQPGHKLRALKAGAKDFISKPFDLVEVKTRIHNMLEVRLLYKRLERFNEMLEQTVSRAHGGVARERSALPQPDRTRDRLVLGTGRGWRVHEGVGPGP